MKIVLIGAGNAASVLGRQIKKAGHEVLQVYSRHLYNGEELADELECSATDKWEAISREAQIYLVALSDTALTELSTHWQTQKGLVLHTAGSVSREVLKNVSRNYGVLYPLQSLRKEKKDYESIPLLIDANTSDDLALLTDFAETISSMVRPADDVYRQRLHVAAVFVNNFTNHLYALAADYCKQSGVSFDLLKPLIIETAERLKDFTPASVQTGPAARGDLNTLEKHLLLLKDYPALLQVYEQMTKSIQSGLGILP